MNADGGVVDEEASSSRKEDLSGNRESQRVHSPQEQKRFIFLQ
jgi:hypothetical protein